MFVVAMPFFGCNVLKCISMNNQECKVIPEIININSNEPWFYPYSVKISGSCNINDPYVKLWVADVSKKMNLKIFNLISRTNETRYIKWHQTCKCKCRLDTSVCNNKQKLKEDKYRSQCKELIDKEICDKGFNWDLSSCEYERDKSWDVGEYLPYKNCKCRKRSGDRLVEECSENIDEKELNPLELHSNKMIYNSTLNEYEKICSSSGCNSCTIYIILFVIFFIISKSIRSASIYFNWHLKRKYIETTIYLMQFH